MRVNIDEVMWAPILLGVGVYANKSSFFRLIDGCDIKNKNIWKIYRALKAEVFILEMLNSISQFKN